MEQFNLDKWLQNKSRKVVTRYGSPVRIVCWDRNTTYWKIIGLVTSPDGSTENPFTYDVDGNESDGCLHDHRNDLFFADEEKELTEFEKVVQSILNEPHFQDIEAVKQFSNNLLNLARKELEKSIENDAMEFAKSYTEDVNPSFEKVKESEELWKWKMSCLRGINKAYTQGKQDVLKDLPKWKKMPSGIQGNNKLEPTYLIRTDYGFYFTSSCLSGSENNMYIELVELENLPKEE